MNAMSKEFLNLVRSIGEAKSKSEEDRIILSELETLKKRLAEPDVPRKKIKEYLIRMVYVEMLGHDASFGYIHAVKLTNDTNLILKRVGYLACTLFLEEGHDFIILIVNTLQNDLKSDNHLVVCAALNTICKIIHADAMPAVLGPTVELLNHPQEFVRKKAVMALLSFHQKAPSLVSHLLPKFRQALCDKDPSVMAASLCALHDLASSDPGPYKNLVPSFVSILKQIIEHRLPKTYDYHRTPAPFMQIRLLKILALLGAGDKSASEGMFSVLGDVLRRGDSGITIGHAVVYECVRTICRIWPNAKLLEAGAEVTSRFLRSGSHNLKYIGIDALGLIVKINPKYAVDHQLAVIDCLEDPDDTLKRKTLDLLYAMTKPANVEVIVERMIAYMRSTTDTHTRAEIIGRVDELAERYAPNNEWFIQTMNALFALGGDLVRPELAHNLLRLIAEGSGEEDDDADTQLRESAVASYLELLEEPQLPTILLQVICWVLGEYGLSASGLSASELIRTLVEISERTCEEQLTVTSFAISAIQKVLAQQLARGEAAELGPEASALLKSLKKSQSTDLQQRAYELQALLAQPPDVMVQALPEDASCEDIEVDPALSFLDGYVTNAITAGAPRYKAPHERVRSASGGGRSDRDRLKGAAGGAESSLRFEAYEPAVAPAVSLQDKRGLPREDGAGAGGRAGGAVGADASSAALAGLATVDPMLVLRSAGVGGDAPPLGPGSLRGAGMAAGLASESTSLRLNNVQRKWGKEGFVAATPPPPPVASASSYSSSYTGGSGSSSSSYGGFAPTVASMSSGGAGGSSGAYVGPSSVPDHPAPVPERHVDTRPTAEMAHKAKLAATLFGGSGGAGGKVGGSRSRPAAKPAAKAGTTGKLARSSSGSPQQAVEVDLMGLDDGDEPPPAKTAPPAGGQGGAGSNDPFSLLQQLTLDGGAGAGGQAGKHGGGDSLLL
eukprot:jgi/Mesvir1/8337/Mv12598-RA.1